MQRVEVETNLGPPLWMDPVANFHASLGGPVGLGLPTSPLGLTCGWSLEDVFTIVFVLVDDSYKKLYGAQAYFRSSPNNDPAFSDAEVLTLAIVAELAGFKSQHKWWKYVKKNYTHLFPRLCDRTRYGRRLKRLRGAMEHIRWHLLFLMNVDLSRLWVVDSFPVSVCHLRRVNSSTRPVEYLASVGYCAAKKEYFYGFRVHLVTAVQGIPVAYVLTPGHVHDTKGFAFLLQDLSQLENLLEALVTILGDKGYVGQEYARRLKQEFGVEMLALRREYDPDQPPEAYNELVGTARKIIETSISVLTGSMHASRTYARSLPGFLTNLVTKITAFNVANYLNRLLAEPVLQITSIVN